MFNIGDKIKKIHSWADPKPRDWEVDGIVETIGAEIYPTSKSNFAIFDKNAVRVKWSNGWISVRYANVLMKGEE